MDVVLGLQHRRLDGGVGGVAIDQDATQDSDAGQASRGPEDRLVANRLALMLDAQGHGQLSLPDC